MSIVMLARGKFWVTELSSHLNEYPRSPYHWAVWFWSGCTAVVTEMFQGNSYNSDFEYKAVDRDSTLSTISISKTPMQIHVPCSTSLTQMCRILKYPNLDTKDNTLSPVLQWNCHVRCSPLKITFGQMPCWTLGQSKTKYIFTAYICE